MGTADRALAHMAAAKVLDRGAEGAGVHSGRVAGWVWWEPARIRIRAENHRSRATMR
jgi:hypothetical protein